MKDSSSESLTMPTATPRDALAELLHEGARRMLGDAIEAEVADYLAERADQADAAGRRLVVRNGHLPERELQTPVGPMPVQQPRVRDHRPPTEREKFSSKILQSYLRRTKSMEELIPWLYLKGVSTNDFGEALQALLGEQPKGLSPTTITRLKSKWADEYKPWAKRDLSDKHCVYVWAYGVHFNIRLEDAGADRQCILVLMGATAEGKKELIAIADGYRESKQSWKELLWSVKHRGLAVDPKLAIGDGALGFWAAVREVWPRTDEQRCWVHKTANVLNKMPTGVQPKAKPMLHEIWMAETRGWWKSSDGLSLEPMPQAMVAEHIPVKIDIDRPGNARGLRRYGVHSISTLLVLHADGQLGRKASWGRTSSCNFSARREREWAGGDAGVTALMHRQRVCWRQAGE